VNHQVSVSRVLAASTAAWRLLLLVTMLSLVALTSAQQPPSRGTANDSQQASSAGKSDGQPPTFRAGANLVRVDVFPTLNGAAVRDLAAADFEVREDGVVQKIETFEHVEVRGQTPQDERREPNSVAAGKAAAEDPRSRLFVVFLDTYHTEIAGSHRMRKVLTDLLDRIIGPDDLFGVMTPEMSATDVTLSRKTQTTEGFLAKYWYWGRRDRITDRDPEEQMYESCFPDAKFDSGAERTCRDPSDPTGQRQISQPRGLYNGVAQEMIKRRREKRTIDALEDLTKYLGGVRDERKAVIAISDGWLLYRPTDALTRHGPCDPPPRGPQIGVGPDGRITNDEQRERGNYSRQTCDTDRMQLAALDNWQTFRDLLDVANRANVSVYAIDSRGLPAFDTQIDEDTPTTTGVPITVDHAMLTTRIDNLRTLADATDGLAVVNNNDLDRGVRRIIDDLTSYYLLGYYSSNPKLDGKFRSIKVRVKRQGVDVRSRRGYKAATEKELTAAREMKTVAAAAAPPSAFQTAMASLANVRPDFRFLTSVSWIAAPIDESVPGAKSRLWVIGEMDAASAKSPEWAGGADAEVLLTAEDGVQVADVKRPLPGPVRVVTIELPDVAIGPGEYALRLRVKPTAGGLPYMDTVRFTVADQGDLTGKPRLLRRGPSTGVQYLATADPRFRRTDRVRIDVPVLGIVDRASGELLDRNGKVLPVTVLTTTREEDGALKWASAEAALAPLAPGDYAIRTILQRGTTEQQIVTAFRIVP
jgi:VWFA-related protein